MASAGLVTVTNTFANKTRERLEAISSNLLAVEPTLTGLVAGLREAVSRVDRYDDRVAGSRVRWSTSWDGCFDEEVLSGIVALIERSCGRG
jgi:hypothetical protein